MADLEICTSKILLLFHAERYESIRLLFLLNIRNITIVSDSHVEKNSVLINIRMIYTI